MLPSQSHSSALEICMIGCDVWFTWTNVDVTILGLLVDLLEVFASDDAIIQTLIRRERCFLTGFCPLGPGNCPIFLKAGLCARWPLSPGSQCCRNGTIWKLGTSSFFFVFRLVFLSGFFLKKRATLSSVCFWNTSSWSRLLWNCFSPFLTVATAWAPIGWPAAPFCIDWANWYFTDLVRLELIHEVITSDHISVQRFVFREDGLVAESPPFSLRHWLSCWIACLRTGSPLSPFYQCCVPRTIWKLKALVFLLVKRLLVHPGLVFQKRTVLSSKLLRNTRSWPELLWNCFSLFLTVAWAPIRPTTPARIAWTWN